MMTFEDEGGAAREPGPGLGLRRQRRRARPVLGVWFAAAAAALLAIVGVTFLATNGTTSATIAPLSTVTGGAAAIPAAVNSSFSVVQGQAQQLAGLEFYRIDVGDPSLSGQLLVHFMWVDPQDASRVLNNPNAFIQVGLYHASGSATPCPSGQYQITDPLTGTLCVTPDPNALASATLTASGADALLRSTTAGQSHLYVLGSITTPGHVPQGQQGQLSGLSYHVDVRSD